LNRNNIETALEALQTDVAAIPDSKIRTTVSGLLNLVEMLYGENETLRDENQQLKDEINRLKGEKRINRVRVKINSNPAVDNQSINRIRGLFRR